MLFHDMGLTTHFQWSRVVYTGAKFTMQIISLDLAAMCMNRGIVLEMEKLM